MAVAALPSTLEIEAEECRRSLRSFARNAFNVVEPGTPFVPNWHIDVICEHLEACSRREIRRLIINVPPRHMKSLLVAVMWPCWEWLANPEGKFMFASYASDLSMRDSWKCRNLIRSPGLNYDDGREYTLLQRIGYQGLLTLLDGDDHWLLADDQDAKKKFANTRMGYRLATSVGALGTGEGGDYVVMDDPHNANDVDSEVKRPAVLNWHDSTIPTRFNDPKTGVELLIMQRLHEEDMTGHLLQNDGWTHLCLPAEYEAAHPFVWPDDPRKDEGDLLWPERIGAIELATAKKELRHRAAGQLQQRPAPAEGIIFKRKDFRYWRQETVGTQVFYVLMDGEENHRVDAGYVTRFQVADVAASDKTTADWTVVSTWAATPNGDLLLLDVERQRFDTLEVHNFLEAANDKHNRPPIWIEQFGAGAGPLKRLLRDRYPAMALKQEVGIQLDKIARAFNAVAAYEDHKVFHPVTGEFVPAFELELTNFPNATNDDQVDTVSYAARLLPGLGKQTVRQPARNPLGGGIMTERF
jgi:predicted phage terminase large subunit-like protein